MHILIGVVIIILCLVHTGHAGNKNIRVTNNCANVVTVGTLTNGKNQQFPEQSFDLTPHASRMVSKPDTWGGRVWARLQCSGSQSKNAQKCGNAGAANPATLAEFFFKGAYGKDFYDISLVDGYNIDVKIIPDGQSGNGYSCGSPSCQVPQCPPNLAIKDATGHTLGCQSTCSKTGAAEHCCTGSHDNADSCKADSQADNVKSACPKAYSFAYDDKSSTFDCSADTYSVTFC